MISFLIMVKPILLVLHFFVAIFLILAILLQSGKGSDVASAFGVGGASAVFGAQGTTSFLSRITTVCAIVFLITSLSLATISKFSASPDVTSSVVEEQLIKKGTNKTTVPPSPVQNTDQKEEAK